MGHPRRDDARLAVTSARRLETRRLQRVKVRATLPSSAQTHLCGTTRCSLGRSSHFSLSFLTLRQSAGLFFLILNPHISLVQLRDPMAISPTTKKVIIDGG